MRRVFLLAAFGVGLAGAAFAHEFKAGSLEVKHPWARAVIGMQGPAAAYFRVSNASDTPDRLVSASSPGAETVELHQSLMEGGVMRMLPVAALEIPAHGEAVLAPGGYHLMLLGLKTSFADGARVPLTLVFEKAGPVEVVINVEKGGGGAAGHEMPGHGGHQAKP